MSQTKPFNFVCEVQPNTAVIRAKAVKRLLR